MTPKEFLSQARDIDSRIDKKIEERERLLAKVTAGRVTHLTGMPRGGNFDWTDAVNAVIEMDKAINAEISALCRIKREVNEAIDAVEDARYRRLLELRYRNYYTWERIADEMGYDVRWVYQMHGKALLHVRIPPDYNMEIQGGHML